MHGVKKILFQLPLQIFRRWFLHMGIKSIVLPLKVGGGGDPVLDHRKSHEIQSVSHALWHDY